MASNQYMFNQRDQGNQGNQGNNGTGNGVPRFLHQPAAVHYPAHPPQFVYPPEAPSRPLHPSTLANTAPKPILQLAPQPPQPPQPSRLSPPPNQSVMERGATPPSTHAHIQSPGDSRSSSELTEDEIVKHTVCAILRSLHNSSLATELARYRYAIKEDMKIPEERMQKIFSFEAMAAIFDSNVHVPDKHRVYKGRSLSSFADVPCLDLSTLNPKINEEQQRIREQEKRHRERKLERRISNEAQEDVRVPVKPKARGHVKPQEEEPEDEAEEESEEEPEEEEDESYGTVEYSIEKFKNFRLAETDPRTKRLIAYLKSKECEDVKSLKFAKSAEDDKAHIVIYTGQKSDCIEALKEIGALRVKDKHGKVDKDYLFVRYVKIPKA